ncbi:MAG: hypothetical protein WD053_05980, partial [Gracilimonas sp.]
EVEAVIESQDFATNSVTAIDDSEFIFEASDHYLEVESGDLQIDEIINDIDVTIEEMTISFPRIRVAPFGEGDSLVVEYKVSESTEIERNDSAPARQIDLSGYRIFANNNQIEYNILAQTENTQTGSGAEARVINESDQVSSSVSINNLIIGEALGRLVPQTVLLSDDDPNNGIDELDLFNENEVELSEIDGLGDLSNQLEGIEFTAALLSLNYTTTIGVPTMVYGAFLGVNGKGESVYLTGINGSEHVVSSQISGLKNNGDEIPKEDLLKFEIDPSSNSGSIVFDSTNTNVKDFMNNLPSEIRFIGKAVVNEGDDVGTVSNPIEIEPKMSVSLPLAFRTTEEATFTDTTEQDLGDFPSTENGDNRRITEGIITVNYDNGLPLNVALKIDFMDSQFNSFETLDMDNLEAAGIDENGFVNAPAMNRTLAISLNEQQLNQLYKTRYLQISAGLLSTDSDGSGFGNEVKVRTTDFLRLTLNTDFTIESEVN